MCGIAGYIQTSFQPIRNTSRIQQMLSVQKHRGPDDSGIRAFSLNSGTSIEARTDEVLKIDKNFEGVMGFNRLSILDLSKNGHQPMASPDGKVFLTLNGEIYNAFDFTNELKDWGYNFKSTTDTEVVLALYLKYGFEGMLSRLNGMFAIVVVDLEKKELLIMRDRFGIKPMYYVQTDEIFAFSSELKSFKYLEKFRFELNEEKIDEYLIFRNNLHGTLYRKIETLLPGHYLRYRPNSSISIKKYFDINDYNRKKYTNQEFEWFEEKVKQWLETSVQSQLMSDVKLGCQLSGGIDSSLVTWLANRCSKAGNFETVSIVFNDPRFSEESYIDHVVDTLQIPSHKFLMDSAYYLDNIESATWHFEAPINHPNTIGIYKLSQRAKDYVTVLLSGEGADEVFGGYGRFYNIAFPFTGRRLLHQLKIHLLDPLSLANYFKEDYRAILATSFMTPTIAKQLRREFKNSEAIEERLSTYQSLSGSRFDRQVKYEIISYLPDLLIRQDKMSMAHSIENRVPFLDNEIVEHSFTIPEKHLLLRKSPESKNTEKYLLKKMTAGTFGNDFAFRSKMGFGIPLREYFLNDQFDEYLHDKILPGIKSRGLFNGKLTANWMSRIKTLGYPELEALWVMVAFEIWASIYIDMK